MNFNTTCVYHGARNPPQDLACADHGARKLPQDLGCAEHGARKPIEPSDVRTVVPTNPQMCGPWLPRTNVNLMLPYFVSHVINGFSQILNDLLHLNLQT